MEVVVPSLNHRRVSPKSEQKKTIAQNPVFVKMIQLQRVVGQSSSAVHADAQRQFPMLGFGHT